MTVKPLTARQQKVFDFVSQFLHQEGFPPTLREIGDAVGLSNINAVRGHLLALEKKGYLTKEPDKARSIRIVQPPSPFSQFKRMLHEVLRTDEGVFHRVVYGLAWTTWRRTPCFTGPAAEGMGEALDREAVEHGWTVLDRRVEPDHIVLVVEVWPNHSADLVVRRFQAAGNVLKARHRGQFKGARLWAKGYAATTDLDLMEELVAKLLQEQPAERVIT